MTTIYIDAAGQDRQLESLVRSAVDGEIARFELALELAQSRLRPFEQKYGIDSMRFETEIAAEDLDGGDDAWVQWAGELKLMQRLQEKLRLLQGIEYGDSKVFRPDRTGA